VALAATVYVIAAFWVDLPPYGIWLEEARSQVRLQGSTAHVSVELSYRCSSWRPRGTVLYLPFSRADGLGPAREVRAEVEEGWTWEAFPDGVLLRLRMAPEARGRARFSFSQDCPTGVFRLPFPVTRGWSRPPSPARWTVLAPPQVIADITPRPLARMQDPGGRWQVEGTTDTELQIRWR
jgi:hypothetical protein